MNFDVSPENLRRHGAAIVDTGDGSAGELGALHGQTTTGGAAAWGTDSAAATLAGLYEELTSATGEALDLLTSVMRHGGTNVQQMAGTYEHTDGGARDGFRRLEGGLS